MFGFKVYFVYFSTFFFSNIDAYDYKFQSVALVISLKFDIYSNSLAD